MVDQAGKDAGRNISSRRPVRWVIVLTVITVVGFGLYLIFNMDETGPSPWYAPKCVFHEATSLHCPGCGATRLLHDLMHGRFLRALKHNPLLFIVLPVLIYVITSRTARWLTGTGLPEVRLTKRVIMGIFWVVMTYWIIRNIPVYPFTLLAP